MATYMDGMDGGKHNSDNTETTATKKKLYHIRQTQPAIQVWYYEVEAHSEYEAIQLVDDGEVDAIDYRVDCDMQEDAEYEVTDVEDVEEEPK
jgi:hypothetical protein